MTPLKMAIQRISSLKPLVVAGVIGAVLVVASGAAIAGTAHGGMSPRAATAVDRAVQVENEATLALASDDANRVTVDLLGSGLRAIASTDLSTLDPETAAKTVRAMAAKTMEESAPLPAASDLMVRDLTKLVKSSIADVDREIDGRREAQISRADRLKGDLKAAIGDRARADAAGEHTLVVGNAMRATLQVIKDAPATATAEGMQDAARRVVAKLNIVVEMHAVDVSKEMATMSETKKSTLGEISKRISALREGKLKDMSPKDLRDDLLEVAMSGQTGTRAADRIVLAALVDSAVENHGVTDVHDLVTKVSDVDIADATLNRVVSILERDERGAKLDVVKELADAGLQRAVDFADVTATASVATSDRGPTR